MILRAADVLRGMINVAEKSNGTNVSAHVAALKRVIEGGTTPAVQTSMKQTTEIPGPGGTVLRVTEHVPGDATNHRASPVLGEHRSDLRGRGERHDAAELGQGTAQLRRVARFAVGPGRRRRARCRTAVCHAFRGPDRKRPGGPGDGRHGLQGSGRAGSGHHPERGRHCTGRRCTGRRRSYRVKPRTVEGSPGAGCRRTRRCPCCSCP